MATRNGELPAVPPQTGLHNVAHGVMARIELTRREINRALLQMAPQMALPASMADQAVPGMARAVPPVAPVGPTDVVAVPASVESIVLFDFAIAGGSYHGLRHVWRHLAVGDSFTLRAEPSNPFDANAVAVHHGGGLKLGYIPRSANAPVASLLATGATIMCQSVDTIRFSGHDNALNDLVWTSVRWGDPRLRLMYKGQSEPTDDSRWR